MIYTALYVLSSAIFGILVHVVGNNMSPWLLIFLCTVNTIIFYHLVNFLSLRKMYAQLFRQDRALVVATMSFIALSTIGSFFIPIYFMPAEFLFAYVCGMTLLGSWESYCKTKAVADRYQVIALGLILGLFYVVIFGYFNVKQYLFFILATLFVSVVTYAYFKLSYKLFQNGFSSVSLLTVRFWPLAIGSGGWALHKHNFHELSLPLFAKVFFISIVLVILPIYLCQKSIEKVGPNIHAVFMGFIPFLTLSLDIVFLRQHFLNQLTILFWILAFVLALVIGLIKLFKSRYPQGLKKFQH